MSNYVDALIESKRYESFMEAKGAKSSNVKKGAKSAAMKDAMTRAGKYVGDHKKQFGIGAGVAAGLTAAGIAAAKISKKKKADKANGIRRENYEYQEYEELMEAVIDGMSEEELLSENSSELINGMCDYFIEQQLALPGPTDEAKKTVLQKAGKFVADHKKQFGIGAGVAAAGAAALTAKKIHDKKANDQSNGIRRENYEYPEYSTLVESIINNFMTEDELLAENASEIAIDTADYMIRNIDNI